MPRLNIPNIENIDNPQSVSGKQNLNAQYFNNALIPAIEECVYVGTDLENGDNIGNTIVTFAETTGDTVLNSGEKCKTLFSKIKALFSKLKSLAFKDKIDSTDINPLQVTTDKIADEAVTDVKVSSGIDGAKITASSIGDEKIINISGSKVNGAVQKAYMADNYELNGNIDTSIKTIEEYLDKAKPLLHKTLNNSNLNNISQYVQYNHCQKQGRLAFIELAFDVPNNVKGLAQTEVVNGRSTWRFTIPEGYRPYRAVTTTISARIKNSIGITVMATDIRLDINRSGIVELSTRTGNIPYMQAVNFNYGYISL